jgi:hypothetical protein
MFYIVPDVTVVIRSCYTQDNYEVCHMGENMYVYQFKRFTLTIAKHPIESKEGKCNPNPHPIIFGDGIQIVNLDLPTDTFKRLYFASSYYFTVLSIFHIPHHTSVNIKGSYCFY